MSPEMTASQPAAVAPESIGRTAWCAALLCTPSNQRMAGRSPEQAHAIWHGRPTHDTRHGRPAYYTRPACLLDSAREAADGGRRPT